MSKSATDTTDATNTDNGIPDATDTVPKDRARGWWSFDLPEPDGWGTPDVGYDAGRFNHTNYAKWRATPTLPDDTGTPRGNVVEVVVQGVKGLAPKVGIYTQRYTPGTDVSERSASHNLTGPNASIRFESWDDAVDAAEQFMDELTPDTVAYALDGSLVSCSVFRRCESVAEFCEEADDFDPQNHA